MESRKWYWGIYFQGSNGETDIEDRLMDIGRGEERVRCMKSNMETDNGGLVAKSCPTPAIL